MLEGEINALIKADEAMARKQAILASIAGLGMVTANLLLATMPALLAARYNPDLKEKYSQLIAAGKPVKVAIAAVMRKLMVLANALIKENRMWTRNPA